MRSGFLEAERDEPTDAPTLTQAGSHLLLVIAAGARMRIGSTDISSAFLNGENYPHDLFFRMPADLRKSLVSAGKMSGPAPICVRPQVGT